MMESAVIDALLFIFFAVRFIRKIYYSSGSGTTNCCSSGVTHSPHLITLPVLFYILFSATLVQAGPYEQRYYEESWTVAVPVDMGYQEGAVNSSGKAEVPSFPSTPSPTSKHCV